MAIPNTFANLEDILNNTRSVVNDAYNAGVGEILTDIAPFTTPYINSAIQELQDRLRNNAVVVLTVDNFILLGLKSVSVDPSLQVFIDYTGYYSLNSTGVPVLLDAAIFLPQDITVPQRIWERQNGSDLPFVPIAQPMEGLTSRSQQPGLGQWEWRASANPGAGPALWFIGSTDKRDLRLRYQKLEANVVPGSNFATIYIDLPGAFNALSYLIGLRYVMSRNPETAPVLRAEADRHIREIIKTAIRQKQSIQYHRRPYGDQSSDLSYGSGQSLPW